MSIRYGFITTYPDGHTQYDEYRSKAENIAQATKLKQWSNHNNKGLKVTIVKFERLYGSTRVLERYEI